jgi:hypothetical protein
LTQRSLSYKEEEEEVKGAVLAVEKLKRAQ